ncbi:MAG: TonB family protein [Puniceicoccaceae bacterium 5H]|nr:MAG: TonB family protein [Puniceicoccaceae bacterium 5H]
MASGGTEDADIILLAGSKVFYHAAGEADDSPVESIKLSDLSPEGQQAVQDWASADSNHLAEIKADQPPEPIHTVGPDLDGLDGIRGVVSVGIVIDSKGNVCRSFVAKSTDDRLNSASLAAVEKWKFRPGKKDGSPVNVIVFVPIQYKS